MADSLAQCVAKFDKLGKLLTGEKLKQISNRLGAAAKKDALAVTAADTGGDLRMRNWKVKLGARYTVVGDGTVKVQPTPSGPSQVLSEGARPHTIVAGKKRRSKAAALRTPYGPRKSVHIPHTRGHQTWDKAAAKIGAETPKRVHQEVVKALGEVF